MERHHIHHAKGLLGEEVVISRMRHDCVVYRWVDISRAPEHGIRFFESIYGVILCEGVENGYLPLRFFSFVIERAAPCARAAELCETTSPEAA